MFKTFFKQRFACSDLFLFLKLNVVLSMLSLNSFDLFCKSIECQIYNGGARDLISLRVSADVNE
jgi:hypothetical protein